jgi:hypothetical protein
MKFEITPLNQFTYTLDGVRLLVKFLQANLVMIPNPVVIKSTDGRVSFTLYHELIKIPYKTLINVLTGMVTRRIEK